MAESDDNKGPAKRPVLIRIRSLKSIIEEGNEEIDSQVQAAVEMTVTHGIVVDPKRLRLWGSDGARDFATKLRERIVMLPVGGNGAAPALQSVANEADAEAAELVQEAAPLPSIPTIRTEKDWIDQERGRGSVSARAIGHGILIAAVLLLGALVAFRI